MTENKTVGRHHQLNGHEFEQTLEDGEGQGRLACCVSWDRKELDTTERLHFPFVHDHRVCDAIQPSHPRSSPSPPAPNPSQHQTLFQ